MQTACYPSWMHGNFAFLVASHLTVCCMKVHIIICTVYTMNSGTYSFS